MIGVAIVYAGRHHRGNTPRGKTSERYLKNKIQTASFGGCFTSAATTATAARVTAVTAPAPAPPTLRLSSPQVEPHSGLSTMILKAVLPQIRTKRDCDGEGLTAMAIDRRCVGVIDVGSIWQQTGRSMVAPCQ